MMEDTGTHAGSITFDATIRPMFRAKDRDSMMEAFDLWSYDDVVAHRVAILHALDSGSMPCDEAWPAAAVAQLRTWIADGCPR
jgi:hypothetical protein